MVKIILTIILLFLCSCQLSHKKDIQKTVQEWQGKEILIPPDLKYKTLGRDTLCPELWNKPYKIFTYVDSAGCTGCRFRLAEWKELTDSCRRQQMDVAFIFAVYSSDFNRFTFDVKFHEFDSPIIYDCGRPVL
jgi:hypothetical protein